MKTYTTFPKAPIIEAVLDSHVDTPMQNAKLQDLTPIIDNRTNPALVIEGKMVIDSNENAATIFRQA
jgi:hypothetical protein